MNDKAKNKLNGFIKQYTKYRYKHLEIKSFISGYISALKDLNIITQEEFEKYNDTMYELCNLKES